MISFPVDMPLLFVHVASVCRGRWFFFFCFSPTVPGEADIERGQRVASVLAGDQVRTMGTIFYFSYLSRVSHIASVRDGVSW